MKNFKALGLSLFIVMCMATSVLAAYPEKNIQGIIMWGAGGGCDGVSRAITPLAEKHLGKTIIPVSYTHLTIR